MGAKRRDVLFQFMAEASMLSFTGGLVGLGLAYGIVSAISGQPIFGPDSEIIITITPDIALLACTVSIGIGLFFGIYPAVRASRLHPIEALRYE
jgi:putative ABC transport system permease protein